ncbi:hypothetical protein [Pseudomonas sp. NPDC079086]|uniref:hypothetical protein n=1 Tax=unclassified Pseudomonas TaxID=196821 RepID=UPI0037C73DB5
MPDFQSTSTPTARKQHVCGECQGHIQPGQQYQLISGSWEGVMDAFKTCLSCVAVRDWATAQPEWGTDGDYLFSLGQLEEDLAYLAPEIGSGDGRRFHAYRLQAQMANRRNARTSQSKAA